MIYTVTLNPAIDRELTVPEMQLDSVLRASESRVDLGGKGFNVSRLLQHLGAPTTAIGLVGGTAGQLLEDGLRSLGIPTDFVWVAGESRTNVSIVTASHDHYLKVNEAGPVMEAGKQEELIDKVRDMARAGDWWVLAGSLPPGVAADLYARLIDAIAAGGAAAVLDCEGEPLRLGCTREPFLVKPNEAEACALAGLRVATKRAGTSAGGDKEWLTGDRFGDIVEAARRLRGMGAQNVAVSMGKEGAVLQTSEGTWLAHSPEIQEKNPIGAGDAMVGGMVWALSRGLSLREALGWGVASGAATASLDGTEVGSRAQIEELFGRVRYEELS